MEILHPEATGKNATRLSPPEPFQGFFTWSPRQQLDAVTKAQSDPHLDAVTIGFFLQEVQDHHLDEVTRNNLANALLVQDQPSDQLAALFARMIDDPAESMIWRAYAVQHLASAYPGRDGEAVVAVLMRAMDHGAGAIAGTAMIQLDRLAREQHLQLDAGFDRSLEARLVAQPNDEIVTMAVLALLGERRVVAALPAIRAFTMDRDPHLRRTAIAALGRIGDMADRSLVSGFVGDPDQLVALAAQAALQRFPGDTHD
jgi:hypothetical protein